MAVPDAHLLPAWVGLTLESVSSTMPRGGLRPCTRSIHWPDSRAAKFLGAAGHCVSKRPHLTRRSRAPLRRLAADNPVHSRIVAQALGVVHILVSGKATKYRLPEQPGQCVSNHLRRPEHHPRSRSNRVRRRVCDKPATQHRRSPGSRETGASSAAVEIQPNSIDPDSPLRCAMAASLDPG
jgi:hypothetical protein